MSTGGAGYVWWVTPVDAKGTGANAVTFPTGESEQIAVWLGSLPADDALLPAGFTSWGLVIEDRDGDGLVSRFEFRDATGGGGIGQNGASNAELVLFSGDSQSWQNGPGLFYSQRPLAGLDDKGMPFALPGEDFTAIRKDMHPNFAPINPGDPVPPCFVRGTRILTPTGEVPVEELSPGDRVVTRDNGIQPLRWVGARRVRVTPAIAPVLIPAGALGQGWPVRDLRVSPQHRVMVSGRSAQLLFGTDSVLVAACHLLGDVIRRDMSRAEVEYFHIMFDTHEIVYADGLPCESLLVTRRSISSFAPETLEELRQLFPELVAEAMAGTAPVVKPARRILRAREATALFGG